MGADSLVTRVPATAKRVVVRASIIITADDFGADAAVNDAVEQAHRTGVLTAASLMVGAPAAADAVRRARTMPGLGVGLHLVLVDGVPVLPARAVPDLVGADGRFRANMPLAGVNFLRPRVRRQLAAEITAQFEAFAATGLPLDHVNAHKHFHVHPVVSALLLAIGPEFGMRAVRAPVEPASVLVLAEPTGERTPLGVRLADRYASHLARHLRRAGFAVPGAVFGLRWTGHLTADRLLALLPHLPPGLVEIYAHPATRNDFPGHASGAAHVAELGALTDPRVIAAIAANGRHLGNFASVVA